MTITLHAQPYDLAATGFYFDDFDTYTAKAAALRNSYGEPVEEFELQFIDGDALDCAFASAFEINQANVAAVLTCVDEWEDWQKVHFIIAVGECGYSFDTETVSGDDFDVDLYGVESLRELAEQFVEDGLYGEIPDSLRFYIDHDAMARDLSADYTETTIAGVSYVYSCA